MNITTKTFLASTLFTTLLAGTSAFAEDRDNLFDWELNNTPTESVVIQKASYQTPAVHSEISEESGRK